MITEIATLPLSAPGDLSAATDPAAQAVRAFLGKVLETPGAREAYYGQFLEKPELAVWFVEWESEEACRAGGSSHPTPLSHLSPHLSSPPRILHVPFSPSSPTQALAGSATSPIGATEVVFFYFPSTLTPADVARIMESVGKMRPVMARSEARGVFDGWAVEEAVPGPVKEDGGEGEMCKVFMNLLGWESVDAHLRFQGSEEFGANIHHVLGIGELRHTELMHVKLVRV